MGKNGDNDMTKQPNEQPQSKVASALQAFFTSDSWNETHQILIEKEANSQDVLPSQEDHTDVWAQLHNERADALRQAGNYEKEINGEYE